MKKCNHCQQLKPLTEFYTNGVYLPKGTQRYKPKCKQCEYEFDRNRIRALMFEFYGELKCQKCGYDKCVSALECHHRNPEEKDVEICKMRTASKSRVFAELEKCDLLCANCHREQHAGMV